MKKVKLFSYSITFIWVLFLLLSACTETQSTFSSSAVITGKFIVPIPIKQSEDSVIIKLIVPNLISDDVVEYEIQPKEDGTFTLTVPLLNASYVGIYIDGEVLNALFLSPGQSNEIEFFYDDSEKLHIKMIKGTRLSIEELQQMGQVNMEIFGAIQDGRNAPRLKLSASPEIYKDSMIVKMEKDLSIVNNDQKLPVKLQRIMHNDLKFYYLHYYLFDYEGQMRLLSLNIKRENKESDEDFIPVKPDRSYYSFLKDFDLNQPPYCNYLYYALTLQSILTDQTLNIPPIGDTPVNEWQKDIKTIMTDLIGTDTGLFYDLLTAKAYFLQMRSGLNSLSDKQKENIQNYFKNPTFIEFLFSENDKLITELSEKLPTFMNETPFVPKEKIMEAIISKYKGKVVVVDFWATWCAPCLAAMKESRGLKQAMLDKDVVFLYITNESSPKKLWEKKIQGIGGEHYYLNEKEWESISYSDKYGFDGIPTYLLFDTNGVLKRKQTMFPGNEEMQKMIEELLP